MMKKIFFLSLLVFMFTKIDCNQSNQASNSIIYAPWRDSYKGEESALHLLPGQCVFCRYPEQNNDKQQLIIERYKHFFIALNLFPYTKGSLLIIPYKHVKQLNDLTNEERYELIDLINSSITILNQALKPDGANVGINLGKVAGASIPDHLHIHIVPRYKSDMSFIQLIGETRIASWDMNNLYDQLKPYFKKINPLASAQIIPQS